MLTKQEYIISEFSHADKARIINTYTTITSKEKYNFSILVKKVHFNTVNKA